MSVAPRRSSSRWRAGVVVPLVGLGLVVLAVPGAVCLPYVGRLAGAGVQLALVHVAPSCDSGLALGGDARHLVTVATLGMVPVLLVQGVAAATGTAPGEAWRAAREVARGVVRPVVPVAVVPAREDSLPVVAAVGAPRRQLLVVGPLLRRGPPVPA